MLIPALVALLIQTPQVQPRRPARPEVHFIGIRSELSQEQRIKVSAAIEQWRTKFAPTFATLGLEPQELANQARSRLATMSMKSPANHDVIRQTVMWIGPTVHGIVGFKAADVTRATNEIESSAGVVAPPTLPPNLGQRPNGVSLPPDSQAPTTPPNAGAGQGAALREFDLTMPLQERSAFDNGSSFDGDNTFHLFNGGQIISPTWTTRISMGQVIPFESAPRSVAVDIDLATDREYLAAAFTAYASISSSLRVSLQDLEGNELASTEVDLGGAIAPFIGQSNPRITAPITVRVPTAEAHGQQVKLVIEADSRSNLFGPGVVSEDVRVAIRKIHVSWIPS